MANWLSRAHDIFDETPKRPTAKAAERPSADERKSANDEVSADLALDYTAADLAAFDTLIRRYCEILGHPTTKREDLLAARRRMRPAAVAVELAELRALVAELGGQL
jgi:hypothetical protein